MRIARKLMLLAAMAIAALAMTASTAAAEIEPVEVLDEATAAHCAPTCTVHATGSLTVVTAHFMGAEFPQLRCADEFSGTINESAEGTIHTQKLMDVAANSCPKEPCGADTQESGDGNPWPFHIYEEAGREWMVMTFCLAALDDTGPTPCTIEVDIEDTILHDYHFVASDRTCAETVSNPVRVEVDGEWDTDTSSVELVH